MQDNTDPEPRVPIMGGELTASRVAENATGPRLVIRRANLDEYSTIRHVQATALRSLVERGLDRHDVDAAVQTIYSQEHLTTLTALTLLVAVVNGDVVGTCGWRAGSEREAGARLGALFVTPLFQGAGIARQLISETELDAQRAGHGRFSIAAPVDIESLFTGLGYTTTSFGTSRDAIPSVTMKVAFLRKLA
jgi:GNAT superfamily N-acetyltransferase